MQDPLRGPLAKDGIEVLGVKAEGRQVVESAIHAELSGVANPEEVVGKADSGFISRGDRRASKSGSRDA